MKINKSMKTILPLAAMSACLTIPAAHAATITGVTIENHSGEFTPSRLAVDTINGSGFTEIGATGYNGTHDTSSGNMWLDLSSAAEAHITYDLGENFDLSSLKIWNYNESGFEDAGVNALGISVASSVGGMFTSIDTLNLTIAPGTNTDFGQLIDLSGFAAANDVRLVRFDITSSHGNGHVGLSEVRFDGAAVPEPSTTALLGLGGLALILRRRK